MTTNSTRRSKCNVDLKRWTAYTAAGAASALACQAAEAEIIYVSVNQTMDVSGGPGTNFSTLVFDVGAASSGQIGFRHLADTSVGAADFGVGGVISGAFAGFSAGGYAYALNLAAGQNISALGFLSGTGSMAWVYGYGNSQFLGAGIGYLGFRFDGGLGTQYGWARVDMSGAPINSFTILDYAFTTEGEMIAAGQRSIPVPEPGTLGLLAAGGAGLLALRRRRRALAAA